MCPHLGNSPADAFAFSLGLVQTTVITASGVEGVCALEERMGDIAHPGRRHSMGIAETPPPS